jgi:rubrerythrin
MAEADPLQYAIQLERDGVAFYTDVAARTKNPLGRKMFEGLAADERRHEKILLDLAAKRKAKLAGDLPKKRLVTLFATVGEQLKRELAADASDNVAIEKALTMERASITHYNTQADAAASEDARALYRRLVLEEQQHVDILQNCLTYLNKTGLWFLWDEQSILDGG